MLNESYFFLNRWIRDPNGMYHPYVFNFEMKMFDHNYSQLTQKYMEKYWWSSLIYAFVYVLLVFYGRKLMSSHVTGYNLRFYLIIWNCTLAAFSIWGTVRSLPEMIYSLSQHGLHYSICDKSYKYGVTGYWAWLFMLSKTPEMIDTLFIVLRKQKLMFLHWFHHASVLIYCFYSYGYFQSSGRWFVCMNFIVHSLMYSYYALRALQIRVPLLIQQTITLLQLIQMALGCFVNIKAYEYKSNRLKCSVSYENIFWSISLYSAYLILFIHFFYVSYLTNNRKPKEDNEQQQKKIK
ncbi:unnamed protein product [Didymodactylos carnosus]|uniref:Elongation of very long chain fatty acids protein n=1 Tax=Didymodactylos carnosus TaxID=1234261 RepID=A0A815R5K0_9BILA|nr:unnamed protein product [Didymodactylos carnosus]CAF4338969.1 unnamed protein product [Didymodactylos carnosus]